MLCYGGLLEAVGKAWKNKSDDIDSPFEPRPSHDGTTAPVIKKSPCCTQSFLFIALEVLWVLHWKIGFDKQDSAPLGHFGTSLWNTDPSATRSMKNCVIRQLVTCTA